MRDNKHQKDLNSLLLNSFSPAGFNVTQNITADTAPENANYGAFSFALNHRLIVYRVGKVTGDRPGAYLTVWQRPAASASSNKPIPLNANQLDYLFIKVQAPDDQEKPLRAGIFIFPISMLTTKGIVPSETKPGKTGFRVFPPWSQNRGTQGTKVFSESGKKSQRWQLPYFIEFASNGLIAPPLLKQALNADRALFQTP